MKKAIFVKFLIYAILIALAASMLLPFWWMVSTSLMTDTEVFQYPPKLLPQSPRWENYPEAMALHYIDDLDSKLEMFAAGYTTAQPLAGRIFERVWPLPGNLVKSLEKFQQEASPPPIPDKLL